MGQSDFGLLKSNNERLEWSRTFVARVLETYQKLPYLEAVQLLRDAYAQSYGICDFAAQAALDRNAVTGKTRPLYSVAMHYAEDFAGTSNERTAVVKFADLKVKDRYGLSLIEFLDLPKPEADFILKDCEKALDASLKANESALNRIESGLNK